MTNKGKESNRWASPVRPFDRLTAQGRPFDTTQGRPFDPAQDRLFGKAQQGNGFHRPLGLVNRYSFEARRTQRRVLFSGESGLRRDGAASAAQAEDGDSPEASRAFGQNSNLWARGPDDGKGPLRHQNFTCIEPARTMASLC
jgi:hypothetical protein